MKKTIALLLAVTMVFAFAACGSSVEPEPQPEPETTTEAVDTSHHVSGLVDNLENAQLSIFTEANQELTFNIENAEIESEDGIKAGDTATVEYTGKITDGDTSGCEVTRIVDVAAAETIIEGKVESIGDDNSVTISSNGREYSFKTKNKGSVKKGDTVKIKYAGVIDGDDTSHAYVRNMEVAKASAETETTKNSISVKVVDEEVWASTEVNVREEADASSKRVGTIKKGTKLTRSGILSNGWSRVVYKDKERYIASSYLTTKDPAKKETKTKTESKTETKTKSKTESKTETKTKSKSETKTESKSETKTKSKSETKTESKSETKTESKSETKTESKSETKTESKSETKTESESETKTESESETKTESESETKTDPSESETVTVTGVVTDVGANTLTLDNDQTFNVKGAKCDVSGDEAMGQKVGVEYIKDTDEAVHVYLVGGDRAIGAEDEDTGGMGGAVPIAIIIVLLAIAVAVVTVVVRNRRRPESR